MLGVWQFIIILIWSTKMQLKKTTISAKIVKKLLTLSIVVIAVAFLIAYITTLDVKDDVYIQTKTQLQNKFKDRLKYKLTIAKTNAISLASNSTIKEALKTNDRNMAINVLKEVQKNFGVNTKFKALKIHVHTKDVKSFVRIWKLDKYGDDLKSFRNTINYVKDTKKALAATEVGRAGLVIRGLAPIIDHGMYLGSLEFIQGYDSIAKKFASRGEELLVLTDKKFVRHDKIGATREFGDYVVTQKIINQDFLESAKMINIPMLLKNGFITDSKYLYTIVAAKDFKNNHVGYYLIGTKLSNIETAVNKAQKAIYFMILIMFIKTLIVMSSVYIITKNTVQKGVENFKQSFVKYVDYTTRKSDTYDKVQIETMDEFGQLQEMLNHSATAYEKIIQDDSRVLRELAETTDKVSEGDYSNRIQASTNNQIVITAKTNINKMIDVLDKDMNSIKAVLASYTQDNYKTSIDIPKDKKAQMKEVMEAINKLGKSLANVAEQNLDKGKHLATNSSLMNNSINVLAQKTNDQSDKVKATSVFAKDIAILAKKNTEHASSMADLGDKVKTLSHDGEKLALDTTYAMDTIVDATVKITESIDTIDQIAFQTNILSLNAAVEAATAGESGKGFAVVAAEVRNLASRSAEAAKNIKELVENATLKAEDGKVISDKMIQGYSQLNGHLNETIKLIENVKISNQEQLRGVEKISDIMIELDHTTRENANEANSVHEISKGVENIAKILVTEASHKKF